jgi:hypothetical protein
VQRDLLEPNPEADVRVYTVWFAMLGGDARAAWKPELLDDRRVRHYWDEDRLAGSWFARQVEGYDGIVWDAYYLYGADARWGESLPAAVSSGSTVIAERKQLEAGIKPMWTP